MAHVWKSEDNLQEVSSLLPFEFEIENLGHQALRQVSENPLRSPLTGQR